MLTGIQSVFIPHCVYNGSNVLPLGFNASEFSVKRNIIGDSEQKSGQGVKVTCRSTKQHAAGERWQPCQLRATGKSGKVGVDKTSAVVDTGLLVVVVGEWTGKQFQYHLLQFQAHITEHYSHFQLILQKNSSTFFFFA